MSFVQRAVFSNVDPLVAVWDNKLNQDGSLFVAHDVVGWYGGTGVRSDDKNRIGGGEFTSRRDRTARNLTFRASIDTTAIEAKYFMKRVLSGMFHDPEGEYELTCITRDGLELTTTVRLDGEYIPADIGLTGVTVSIPLKAGDPRLYGPWRTSMLRPVDSGVGLEFPLFSTTGAISYGSAVSTGDYVWNDGNTDAHNVYEVVGNFPGGFRIQDGDQIVEWPQPTYPQAPVIVDMAGSVTVRGMDQSQYLTRREWLTVPRHSISTPRFTSLQDGTGWCTVYHRDTYI